jgi:hypothetical protein
MSGVVKFVAGIVIMFVGVFTGNLPMAQAGYALAWMGALEEVSKLFLPKPPKLRSKQDVEYSGTVEPRRIIYGYVRTSGMNTVRPVVTGTKGKYLHQVLTVAGHEVEDIRDVFYNSDTISDAYIGSVAGAATDGLVSSGIYANRAWIRRYLGTASQTVDFILNAATPDLWDTNHRGRGVAYVALQFQLDQDVYGTGKPQVAFMVKGKKVYDPRLDGTPGADPTNPAYIAYSKNPALCLADYLADSSIGVGIAASKIDWTMVVTAANVCDESVSIPGTPATQSRYTCSVVLESTPDPIPNIKSLASAMMGICYRQGGKYRMYAGCALTPSFTLTSANIVGPYTFRNETPQGEKYNYVRGTFSDEDRLYQESEYEPRGNTSYEADDGIRISKDAPFLTATNKWEAQRNSLLVSRRSRMAQTLSATFDLSAFKVRPWDIGSMTFSEIGWTNQRVVCVAWEFVGNGSINMSLQEDDAAIWDDPVVGAYITPGTAGSASAAAYAPDEATSLTATSVPGGISFSWTLPAASIPGDVIQLFEYTASTPFSSATMVWEGAATGTFLTKSVTTQYYYWIRSRATNGNTSDPYPATTGVSGKALSVTTSLSANASSGAISATDVSASKTTGSITVTPAGGTAPYTYAWTKVSGATITADSSTAATTTFTATSLTSGETRVAIFRCTVTDNVAATATADVTVTIARVSMTAAASPTSLSTSGVSASLTTASTTVTPTGGVATYTYAWTKVSGGSITANSSTAATTTFTAGSLTVGESRTAIYRCTVTDSTGGTPLTATVDVPVAIDRAVAMTVAIYPTSIGELTNATAVTTGSCTATPTNGLAPYSYAWTKVSGGAITVDSSTSATTTFSATGLANFEVRSAVYRVTVTDSNSPTAMTATADITVEITCEL